MITAIILTVGIAGFAYGVLGIVSLAINGEKK